MANSSSSPELSAQQQLEAFGYKQELKRSVSTADLLVYGLVFMVPIAPWAIFGVVYNAAGGMVPLVYAIGLIAMIFTALAYQQMAKSIPLAGSVFSYVGRGLHPTAGFFAGWAILLDYLLVPTLLYVFAAESMVGIFPDSPRWLWALIFVAVNTVVNLLGISSIKRMNRIFLAIELIFVVIFVVIAVNALATNAVPGAELTMNPIWDATKVTGPLIASALSIAVLSFLGFDGISTMSEEATGGRNAAGRAMIMALFLVAFLFILQTWLASALAGGRESFNDDEVGNAFFTIVAAASNSGWMTAFFVVNVLAIGVANAMAAQAATSRLLYSMSRDRQLPRFLSRIDSRQVPRNAIILVSAISAVLVLFFVGQIDVISALVNFGALFGFMLLHLSVIFHYIVHQKSKNYVLHLLVPVLGFLIIGYVLLNAAPEAKIGGAIWLAVGAGVFAYYKYTGRTPDLSEENNGGPELSMSATESQR
ncbi:APC family permease [Arthrobacter sp. AL08]|uniref:APC family permease n=1 Tax=Micrococcaceae TaxID=1268 RepID=UPI00249CBBD6|nr:MULTISPECIES: APC family permease [Micrococcaceae]MDI3240162.1 APC family permease [Arthrobacter sp. AL05]MDI3276172.1 APC family permease [Arthrobacter sp. AL08]MDJ0353822.1 APC family permease [Pseudarthrobacter sp. PH31-O2]